jgi:hypothetical protein
MDQIKIFEAENYVQAASCYEVLQTNKPEEDPANSVGVELGRVALDPEDLHSAAA